MDGKAILAARVERLDEELRVAASAIAADELDQELRDRVAPAFADRIALTRESLEQVGKYIDRGVSLDQCWSAYQPVHEACVPLFRECLAFLQGAAARRSGVDDDLCRLADVMLDELSAHASVPWAGFAILAEGEFFEEMAAIVRLRFPEVSIWNLPIAAHEFGHFVIQQVEVRSSDGRFDEFVDRFQQILPAVPDQIAASERERLLERRRRFMHEYYADAFATYSMGPAYAYTCLLLRFDPVNSHLDGADHPSDAKRAHLILEVMEEMNAARENAGEFQGPVKGLRATWAKSVASANAAEQALPPEAANWLNDMARTLHQRLGSRMRRARYTGWPRAAALTTALRDGALAAPVDPQSDLRDVLNAAWRSRVQSAASARKGDMEDLGARAKVLCQAIAARPRAQAEASSRGARDGNC